MTDHTNVTLTDDLPVDMGSEMARSGRGSKVEHVVATMRRVGTMLWRDTDDNAYATIVDGTPSPRHYRVKGSKFTTKVRHIYRRRIVKAGKRARFPSYISNTEMIDVISTFEADALDGPVRQPDVRVVDYENAIWLDLCDEEGRRIRMTPAGWKVEAEADVPLMRSGGMRALPVPQSDHAALANLRKLLNIENEDDFRLVVAWLVAAFFPVGPYTILALTGEQGTGKSLIATILRRLVDPNRADLRGMPRKEEDFVLAALNSRVVALDNLSEIKGAQSDWLCRLSTGGGFSKRQHYTDADEIIWSVTRPVILTSIPNVVTRGDLADRTISITLSHISREKRRTKSEIMESLVHMGPGILACVLDGVVMALKLLPTLEILNLPRMADFACIACAAAPAFGWSADEMFATLERNQQEASAKVIDTDPFAEVVFELAALSGPEGRTGTATDFQWWLDDIVPAEIRSDRAWPKNPTQFRASLDRIAGPLRRVGVDVVTGRREGRTGRRLITIRMTSEAEEGRDRRAVNSRPPIRIIKRDRSPSAQPSQPVDASKAVTNDGRHQPRRATRTTSGPQPAHATGVSGPPARAKQGALVQLVAPPKASTGDPGQQPRKLIVLRRAKPE